LVNTVNGKRYIGSAKDFFRRRNEHLNSKNNSNAFLQKAFVKYGFGKFKLCIYEYFSYESRIISHKYLTELETSYLSKFKIVRANFFSNNFLKEIMSKKSKTGGWTCPARNSL